MSTPTPPPNPGPSALDRFLSAYWADENRGEVETLSAYLMRFPGDDVGIAAEFHALERARGQRSWESEPGARISHYRLERELGRGGQAVVYLATDLTLGRHVALKVLRTLAVEDQRVIDRFRREAEVTSRLDHPSICSVYEAGIEQRTPYIAMKYIQGSSLAARLATLKRVGPGDFSTVMFGTGTGAPVVEAPEQGSASGPSTREDVNAVIQLVEDVARAVHVAHENGVVHRDLKPGNIMVGEDGRPVVVDFGLASEEGPDAESLTERGGYLGTRAYMSPEQFLAKPVRPDRRTDVWALGVTLFECITLTRPFHGAAITDLILAIQSKPAPDPRKMNAAVPSELRVVIETALEKDRDRRYQTALDFAEDLERVRNRLPILARPASKILRLKRWFQRNQGLALSVSSVLMGLAAGLVVALLSLKETKRALAEVQLLDDITRVAELEAWADDLWPAVPELVPGPDGMDAWIDKARHVLAREGTYVAAFRELGIRADTQALEPETRRFRPHLGSELDRLVALRESWTQGVDAPNATVRETVDARIRGLRANLAAGLSWMTGQRSREARALVRLVGTLERLPGILQQIEGRRDRAQTYGQQIQGEHAAIWEQAQASITTSYEGLELRPMPGLYPLGVDKVSGYWEFAHLETGSIPDRRNGQLRLTAETAMILVLLPGGISQMGASSADRWGNPEEERRRAVRLAPFLLAKHEATRGQWRRVMGTVPLPLSGADIGLEATDRHPVESVSWDDCAEFARRLGLRLPTEAQWEYGARAGKDTEFTWGPRAEDLEGKENIADQSVVKTLGTTVARVSWDDGHPTLAEVGVFPANAFGLHDVHGNVSEWCLDTWAKEYPPAEERPGDGLNVMADGPTRVSRGGSWRSIPATCGSARRMRAHPGLSHQLRGVRLAGPAPLR